MFAHITYEEVLKQAQLLSPDDQARLLEELTTFTRHRAENQQFHSIMELEGLGKEIWHDIDVEKFIEEERNSWDG